MSTNQMDSASASPASSGIESRLKREKGGQQKFFRMMVHLRDESPRRTTRSSEPGLRMGGDVDLDRVPVV